MGLSVGLYQLNCLEMYCYVNVYRPMCGYVKQFRAVVLECLKNSSL